MIVAFTGGRHYGNWAQVEFVMDLMICVAARCGDGDITIRVGDCPTGLDQMVRTMPFKMERPWVAHWTILGLKAGPIRNGEMLIGQSRDGRDEGRADLLIAFPGGSGTADCVRQARELGIAVLEVPK